MHNTKTRANVYVFEVRTIKIALCYFLLNKNLVWLLLFYLPAPHPAPRPAKVLLYLSVLGFHHLSLDLDCSLQLIKVLSDLIYSLFMSTSAIITGNFNIYYQPIYIDIT